MDGLGGKEGWVQHGVSLSPSTRGDLPPSSGGGQAGTNCPEHPPWHPFPRLLCPEAPGGSLRTEESEATLSKVQWSGVPGSLPKDSYRGTLGPRAGDPPSSAEDQPSQRSTGGAAPPAHPALTPAPARGRPMAMPPGPCAVCSWSIPAAL